jgi:hypothetical protein
MKLNIKLLAGLIASVAVSLSTSSAALTTAAGDLLLSFYTQTGLNAGPTTYTVNLGSTSSLLSGAPKSLYNLNSDLTTAFGSGWATNTSLKMALIGGFGESDSPSRTIYAGSKLTNIANKGNSTRPSVANRDEHELWAFGVGDFTTQLNGAAANGAVTANSAIIATSGSDVTDFTVDNPGTYFGAGWDPTTSMISGNITGTLNGNSYKAALDVWNNAYTSSGALPTASYLMTIGLTSGGDLNVAAAAVPEPSTFVMSGLALLAGMFLINRKKKTLKQP